MYLICNCNSVSRLCSSVYTVRNVFRLTPLLYFRAFSVYTVARRVCERGHKVSGKALTVALFKPSAAAGEGSHDNVIIVMNIPPSIDREYIEMYFESQRRSGGGDIEDIRFYREENTAVITYEEKTCKFEDKSLFRNFLRLCGGNPQREGCLRKILSCNER